MKKLKKTRKKLKKTRKKLKNKQTYKGGLRLFSTLKKKIRRIKNRNIITPKLHKSSSKNKIKNYNNNLTSKSNSTRLNRTIIHSNGLIEKIPPSYKKYCYKNINENLYKGEKRAIPITDIDLYNIKTTCENPEVNCNFDNMLFCNNNNNNYCSKCNNWDSLKNFNI